MPNGSEQQQVAASANQTIGSIFATDPGTVAWSSVNGPQVWINPLLVNPGDAQQDLALIAHETLINLGLQDPTIQQDLGIAVTPYSVNINQKLQNDCFPGPPGNILN
jgi:hypothetical protein